jgi:hypothetical protein
MLLWIWGPLFAFCKHNKETSKSITEPGAGAHACNPSYSGGRDQEDHSLKPARPNSSQDPISKSHHKKRVGGVAQGVGPEFKPQYHRHKKYHKEIFSVLSISNLFSNFHCFLKLAAF